jgi:HSP20 family protein
MAEAAGTRRQREQDQTPSLTPSERTEGRVRQQSQGSQGMERYQQGRYTPSVFSVSPGEFFTLSPITLMRRFTEDIDRAFGLASGRRGGTDFDTSDEDIAWVPTVEVRQQGNSLVIHADLPGLSENDVRVEATDDGLVIQGERKREQTVDEGGVIRTERVYGRFYRLIPLPDGAQIESTKANFRNGVLEITVPVPESERRNRQIPISASGQSSQSSQSNQSSQSSSSEQGSSGERSRTATSSR